MFSLNSGSGFGFSFRTSLPDDLRVWFSWKEWKNHSQTNNESPNKEFIIYRCCFFRRYLVFFCVWSNFDEDILVSINIHTKKKTSVVLWRHTIRTGKVKLSKLTAAISGPFKGAKIAAFTGWRRSWYPRGSKKNWLEMANGPWMSRFIAYWKWRYWDFIAMFSYWTGGCWYFIAMFLIEHGDIDISLPCFPIENGGYWYFITMFSYGKWEIFYFHVSLLEGTFAESCDERRRHVERGSAKGVVGGITTNWYNMI